MRKVILDIITSKKGSSGKTLISLFKFDLGIKNMYNVIGVDTNDMNPDMYTILHSIFRVMQKVMYDESEKMRGISNLRKYLHIHQRGPNVDIGSLSGFNYVLTIRRTRYDGSHNIQYVEIKRFQPREQIKSKDIDDIASKFIVRFSTLDMIWVLNDLIDYVNALDRRHNSDIDYIVIDTNTSCMTFQHFVQPIGKLKLSVMDFPFAGSIVTDASEVDACLQQHINRLIEAFLTDKSNKQEKRTIDLTVVITFILPLFVFLNINQDNSFLEKELEVLRNISQRLETKFVPHIIANMYSHIDQKTIQLVLKKRNEIIKFAENMASAFREVDIEGRKTSEGYILSLDSIIKLIKLLPEEDIRSEIVEKIGDMKESKKDKIEILAKLLTLELCLRILQEKYRFPIINFTVMPIFDIELSHIVEIMRSDTFRTLIENISESDYNSSTLYSFIINYGLFTGLLPLLGVRIKRTKALSEMIVTKGVLTHFLEDINRFVRGVAEYG